jgi:hypothetical protein
MRCPERSSARAYGTFWLSETFLAAAAQSSQVAFSPGSATPAWSNKVLLAKPPVSVICVMKPVIALEPSGRIQSAWSP